MSDVIDFPGEYRTEHDRDPDRWTTVALLAVMLARYPEQEKQLPFLRAALSKFRDVPDEAPDFNDVPAYTKYAVKLLLEALIDDSPEMREAARLAGEIWFNELVRT